MESSKFTIIFLISTVLSLLFIILTYFGIVRYCSMYLFSPDSYVENYKKLDIGDSDRVVLSLTTTPENLKNIKPVINSLLDQTVKVNLIAITVPYGKDYILPKNVEKASFLYRTGINYGIANSIIPVLIREGERNTKIITLGDNIVYGKDFIENILTESKKYPDKIIYVGKNNAPIDLTKGALFKTEFFSEDFLDMPENYDGNRWVNKHISKKHAIKYKENFKKM